ncbi:MAG TPA: metalloregulator ArsR/SmtB family transcription factor [Dongiaceae bacterium]|nr:metalloregulator ArsR/SmtB family transcription factor [Dongiaceae bacterium]
MRQRSATRLLHALKSAGPQSAAAMARRLGITSAAARQHLAKLKTEGLVAFEVAAAGVGRPRHLWHLTEKGHGRFPDSHAGLALELIQTVRRVFGAEGLESLIAEREKASLGHYKSRLGRGDLRQRVRRLAALRSEEGYMAEVAPAPGGGYLLKENHCPICVAAKACQGLCRSELALFRAALGPGVEVERLEHVLAGARRCAYRIRPLAQ